MLIDKTMYVIYFDLFSAINYSGITCLKCRNNNKQMDSSETDKIFLSVFFFKLVFSFPIGYDYYSCILVEGGKHFLGIFMAAFVSFNTVPLQWFKAPLFQPLFTHKATCFEDSGMFC